MKIKKSIISAILMSIGLSGIAVADNSYPDSLDLNHSRIKFGIKHDIAGEMVGANPQTGVTYGEWSSWETSSHLTECTPWIPDAKTVLWGKIFIQTNLCEGEEERTRTVTYYYSNGDERTEIEVEHQFTQIDDERYWYGEKDYIKSQKTDPGAWVLVKPSYNCSGWSPDPSTVSKGKKYTQSKTCKEDYQRDVDVYNVWASGKDEFVETKIEKETRNKVTTRSATGTKQAMKSCNGKQIPIDAHCSDQDRGGPNR